MAQKAQSSAFAALPVGAKIFILFALLAVTSAGYYLGLHMGLTKRTRGAIVKNTQLQGQLQEAGQRQKEYLQLREELANREALNQQMIRVLPESAEIPAFLNDLNRLAELSGLHMSSVKPEPEVVEEFYVKVPVGLKLSGRYHQLAKFFYNISRLERAINMENISLQDPKNTGEEVILEVEVMATTFRRKGES